jgi:hypothetical protein
MKNIKLKILKSFFSKINKNKAMNYIALLIYLLEGISESPISLVTTSALASAGLTIVLV